MKCKHDNRGLTLIELLIGIAILGIIAVPLLSTLIGSANTAARSRTMGDANLAAESILETLEAQAFATGLTQDVPTFPDLGAGEPVRLYPTNDDTADNRYRLYDAETDPEAPYYLAYPAVQSGGETFSAVLMLDPVGDAGNYQAINDTLITQYNAIDVVFAQSRAYNEDSDAAAFLAFQGMCMQQALAYPERLDDPDLLTKERRISLDITQNGGAAEATVSYQYTFSYIGGEVPVNEVISYSYPLTMPEETEPQTYYLFYYPWYYENGRSYHETISVNIDDAGVLPATVVLVRQQDSVLPDFVGDAMMMRYRTEVQFAQPDRNLSQAQALEMVRSNAWQPLVLPGANPDETHDDTEVYADAFVRLGVGGSGMLGSSSQMIDVPLYAQQAYDRIFAVTVELYTENTGVYREPLLTYTATNLQ